MQERKKNKNKDPADILSLCSQGRDGIELNIVENLLWKAKEVKDIK